MTPTGTACAIGRLRVVATPTTASTANAGTMSIAVWDPTWSASAPSPNGATPTANPPASAAYAVARSGRPSENPEAEDRDAESTHQHRIRAMSQGQPGRREPAHGHAGHDRGDARGRRPLRKSVVVVQDVGTPDRHRELDRAGHHEYETCAPVLA